MTGAGRTVVVTDSTADLPPEIAEANGILVVPAVLIVDDVSYEDGQGLSRQEFYRRMPIMAFPPTTASPPLEAFLRAYRLAFDRGAERVVSVHVAGQLSSIVDTAHQAAGAFPGRIDVVDSGQVSLGLGFQVLRAARSGAAGRSADEVIAAAAAVRDRVRTIAMIDDLEYLRRSGRVDWLRSTVTSVLRLRLIVELSGGIVRRLAQVRTRGRAIESLVQRAADWGPLQHLGVLHSNAAPEALSLADRLASQVIDDRPLVVDVTTVIGTHVGPRCLGFVGVLPTAAALATPGGSS